MKLVYDVNSVPSKLGIANMVKIMENHRVVFYDSEAGLKPKFYGSDENEILPMIVDTHGKEIDLAFYEEQYKEEEFWKKELFNCKNSPTYFFTNYGTTEYPHKSEDLKKFLAGLGLEDLKAANSGDSEAAAKDWELQKTKFKEALAFITIDLLKERKAVMDTLVSQHNSKIEDLEKFLKPFVGLVDNKGVKLDEKKASINLINKIKQVRPVHPAYSDKYRTSKGKWDTAMLYNTPYYVLLEMFYTIKTSQANKA